MRIINFGSLNLDYTYSVDHIVEPERLWTRKSEKSFVAVKD